MAKQSRDLKDLARATIEVATEERAVAQMIHDLKQFAREQEVGAKMHPAALGAIAALLRRDLLSSIQAFLEQVAESARNIAKHYEVNVTSAMALTSAERSKLKDILAKRLDGEIALEERTDASLLGGFILESGSWQFDASVIGKIKRLHKSLATSY